MGNDKTPVDETAEALVCELEGKNFSGPLLLARVRAFKATTGRLPNVILLCSAAAKKFGMSTDQELESNYRYSAGRVKRSARIAGKISLPVSDGSKYWLTVICEEFKGCDADINGWKVDHMDQETVLYKTQELIDD